MSILTTSATFANEKKIQNIILKANSSPRVSGNSKEANKAVDFFKQCLVTHDYLHAVAYVAALMLWDANDAITKLRQNGAFRASRYDYKSQGIRKVINSILEFNSYIDLQPELKEYLNSVTALLTLSSSAYNLHSNLHRCVVSYKTKVLKTLLVLVDYSFVNNRQADIQFESTKLHTWGAEDFALSFSYILNLMREKVGVGIESWQFVDDNLIAPTESIYSRMLIDAQILTEYREAESLLDGLPYRAIIKNKSVEISSVDESFEKTVRLGYIQTDIQMMIRALGMDKMFEGDNVNKPLSMDDCVGRFLESGMDQFFQIVPKPIERLVFKVPHLPPLEEFLKSDVFLREEVASLVSISIEEFQDISSIGNKLLSKIITVVDVVKVQRLFGFISSAFNQHLTTLGDERRRNILLMRSIIPLMTEDSLIKILSLILSEEKAKEMIDLLTLKESDSYIDLQYKPFIKCDEHYIISPALVQKSNLSRNIVVSNKTKNLIPTTADPMETALVKALERAGFLVKPNFNFEIDGEKRETDIFCWLDNNLFVFECKNSFHPCSPHELRTSLDHIKKAETQLDIRVNWLKDLNNQKKLIKAMGWAVSPTAKIHSGIITANRLMNGYHKGIHPVRQAFELINVIEQGVIVSNDLRHTFWSGDKFSVNDLIDYLQGKNIIQMQIKKLQPFLKSVPFEESTLSFLRYYLDLNDMDSHIKKEFREFNQDRLEG